MRDPEVLAQAKAHSEAHAVAAPKYRDDLASAEQRDRLRRIEADAKYRGVMEAAQAALNRLAPDHDAIRASIAAAEKDRAKAIAESARMCAAERDAAWHEYRHGPGWSGESR